MERNKEKKKQHAMQKTNMMFLLEFAAHCFVFGMHIKSVLFSLWTAWNAIRLPIETNKRVWNEGAGVRERKRNKPSSKERCSKNQTVEAQKNRVNKWMCSQISPYFNLQEGNWNITRIINSKQTINLLEGGYITSYANNNLSWLSVIGVSVLVCLCKC